MDATHHAIFKFMKNEMMEVGVSEQHLAPGTDGEVLASQRCSYQLISNLRRSFWCGLHECV